MALKFNIKKILKWLLPMIVVFLLIGMGVIYSLRELLIAPHLSAWITNRLKEEIGLILKIDRISGTYFNGITLEGLEVSNPSGLGPLTTIRVKHLELYYSPIRLIGGIENFVSNSHICITQADIALDLTIPDQSRQGEKAQKQFQLPVGLPSAALLPKINIEKCSLLLISDYGSSEFKNISVNTEKDSHGNVYIEISSTSWSWRLGDLAAESTPVKMSLTCSQNILGIDSFVIGENGFATSGKIDLTDLSQSLPFEFHSLIGDAPLGINGYIKGDGLYAAFKAKDMDLKNITSIASSPEYKADGQISFSGELHIPLFDLNNMYGNTIIDMKNIRFRGLETDSIHTRIAFKERSASFQEFIIRDSKNTISISNLTLPFMSGFLPLDKGIIKGLSGSFELDLQDIPNLMQMAGLNMGRLDIPGHEHRVTIIGQLEKGGIISANGEILVQDNRIFLNTCNIKLPQDDQPLSQSMVDVKFHSELNDLRLVQQLLPLPPMTGKLYGDIVMQGSLASPNGYLIFKGKDIGINNVDLGELTIHIEGDAEHVLIKKFEITNGYDLLSAEGRFFTKSRTIEDAILSLKVTDIQPYLALWSDVPSPMSGDLYGTIRLRGPMVNPEGSVKISSNHFQIDRFFIADAELEVFGSARKILLNKAEANIMGGLLGLAGTMEWDNELRTIQAHLNDLYIRRKNLNMKLSSPTHITYSWPGTLDIKDLVLSGSMGDLRFNGRIDPKGSSEFYFKVINLRSGTWLDDLVEQRINIEGMNAQGFFMGTFASPQIKFTGQIDSLTSPYLPASLHGAFNLSLNKNRVIIEQFNWEGAANSKISLSGGFPVNYIDKTNITEDSLLIDALIQLPDLRLANLLFQKERVGSGSVFANLQIRGSLQDPWADLVFKTKGLTFESDLVSLPPGPMDIESIIHYKNGRTSIQSLDLKSPVLSFTGRGEWTNGPRPASANYGLDGLLKGDILFNGHANVSNLSWLSSGVPALRRISGQMDADFSLKGPVSRPDVSAKVELKEGALRVQADFPPLEDIQLKAMVTPRKIDIHQCTGSIGGANADLRGEIVDFMTDNPFLDLKIWGENLLLYRTQDFQFRADTDLALQGPFQEMRLTGEISVTEGRFSSYIDLFKGIQGDHSPETDNGLRLFSIREAPLNNMRLDINIRSKGSFIIRNNLIRGRVRPNLRLTGTGEVPVVRGELFVDTASIRLPSGNMTFENGYVQMIDPDPNRPELNLLGNARMLGYDITALVEGPYDEPIVTLSSSPPLSNEDILLLLLTGTLPATEGQTLDKRTRSLNVAIFLGRDLLNRWYPDENTDSDKSILDRFEAEVGRDITQKGEETLEVRFRLASDVVRQGDTLYLTGERDVFNFYNAGLRFVFRLK